MEGINTHGGGVWLYFSAESMTGHLNGPQLRIRRLGHGAARRVIPSASGSFPLPAGGGGGCCVWELLCEPVPGACLLRTAPSGVGGLCLGI